MKEYCRFSRYLFPIGLLIVMVNAGFSQSHTKKPVDLRKMAERKEIEVFNRSMAVMQEGSRTVIHLDAKEGDGIAWLKGVSFANGTLEFDARGKDLQGQSFVGIAFHGLDNNTFDVIYLRPFNFRAEDKIRKSHSVQYASSPAYSWNKLREEFPGKYEQPIEPAPDPNGWVHVRVVIANPVISVYINDNSQPSLSVNKLTQRATGSIGLWVGNGSAGDFANVGLDSRD